MGSPFPGMDPYLTTLWSSAHLHLILALEQVIRKGLPPGFYVTAEEDLVLRAEEPETQRFRPDVGVRRLGEGENAGGTAVAAKKSLGRSFNVVARSEPNKFREVKIYEAGSRRLVTAIEILSPRNKRSGAGNRKYLDKLAGYEEAGISVVEVDLLVYPTRTNLPVSQGAVPSDDRASHLTCVQRAWKPWLWQVFPMEFRERLPVIPIPLRESVEDAQADLQTMIEQAYESGGFGVALDYREAIDFGYSDDDQQWIAERAAQHVRSE